MRAPVAPILVAVVLALPACARTLDTASLEERLAREVERALGERGFVVACPDGVRVAADATFECTASGPGGAELVLRVRQVDDAGNVEWAFADAELTEAD
ncbi:MAG: hypothetical protein KatS3mg013_0864 [Actinomycetota bacterium]|jgi:hypothetical protein|nr:MAG: hypothetical protein KatS3mg013_0864 [Actinomycetota bacterium]